MTDMIEFRPTRYTVLVSALALLLLGACSQKVTPPIERNFVATDVAIPADMTVAVVPFDNLTNHPNAGVIAAQLMSSELYSQNLFSLTEEGMVRRALAELGTREGSGEVQDITQLARALSVQAVLIGSVSEYGYQHSLSEEPAVGINVRLVLWDGEKVLWAASHSEVGGGESRESLNQMAQRIVQRMILALLPRIANE